MISDKKKYVTLNQILSHHNIDIMFGDDNDYLKKLYLWIGILYKSQEETKKKF